MINKLKLFTTLIVFFIISSTSGISASYYGITVAWDANPETDIAGYKILYGTSSGQLTNVIDVGNVLQVTILNLTNNISYYLACKAYNTGGLESDPCSEITSKISKLYITNVFHSETNQLIFTNNTNNLTYSKSFVLSVSWPTNFNNSLTKYIVTYGLSHSNITNSVYITNLTRLGLLGVVRSSNYYFNIKAQFSNNTEQYLLAYPASMLISTNMFLTYTNLSLTNYIWRPSSPSMLNVYY